MADMSNAIAQAGMRMGQNINNTFSNARANNQAQSNRNQLLARQDAERDRILQAQAAEKQAGMDEKQRLEQMDYAKQGVGSMMSADPMQQANVYHGWRQEGIKRGYDMSDVPEVFEPAILQTLVGATGYVQPGPKANSMPSNVQEWEYYNSLNPPQQEQYLQMKRADKWINRGPTVDRVSPTTGDVNASVSVAPKVSETPEFKSEVATAVTDATEAAKNKASTAKEQEGAKRWVDIARGNYDFLDGKDLDKIYGRGESLMPDMLRSQEGIDMIQQRDQLISILKLGARGTLKGQGPITEGEQGILSDAVTTLSNPNISPDAAKAALDGAMKIIYRSAGQVFDPSGAFAGETVKANGFSIKRIN